MHQNRENRGLAVMASLAMCLVLACGEPLGTYSENDTDMVAESEGRMLQSVSGAIVSERSMRTILKDLTRNVALALNNEQTRAQVHSALANSPYRENKLHFRTLLESEQTQLQRHLTDDAHVLSSRLDSLVDIEFYMPVPEHRTRWNGGDNLIVASTMFDDKSTLVAFDLDGKEVVFASPDTPPETPALVLVSAETDFGEVPSKVPPTTSAPQQASSSSNDGIWVRSINISDDHEHWTAGSPEFEAHAFMQFGSDSLIDRACASEQFSQASDQYWDYDNAGTTYLPDFMIAAQSEVDSGTVSLQLWEDDSVPCRPYGSAYLGIPPKTSSTTVDYIEAMIVYWSTLATVYAGEYYGAGNYWYVFDTGAALWSFGFMYDLITRDDHVGLVDPDPVDGCWPASGPAKHNIIDAVTGNTKGWVYVDPDFTEDREPLCPPDPVNATIGGPNRVQPGSVCTWTASATGGVTPYSFSWSGKLSGTGSSKTASISQSGYIYLTASDGQQPPDTDGASMWVEVTWSAPECGF